MTKKQYRVKFERTLHEKTTVEGTLTLAADDESETELMDRIDERLDDESEERELEEIDEEVDDDEIEVVYDRIRYQEISVAGEAPVVAESAQRAGEKFLNQVQSTHTRGSRTSRDAEEEFEIIEIDEKL